MTESQYFKVVKLTFGHIFVDLHKIQLAHILTNGHFCVLDTAAFIRYNRNGAKKSPGAFRARRIIWEKLMLISSRRNHRC